MILITGSKGKVGKSLVNYLKKNKLKIVETQRSKNYRVISDRCIGLDLLNKHHLKKLFNKFKFKHLVHLAVTRNPFHLKEIRNFETTENDTMMMVNLLKFCNNLISITFTSSASVYALKNVKDNVKRDTLAKKITNFLKSKKKIKLK